MPLIQKKSEKNKCAAKTNCTSLRKRFYQYLGLLLNYFFNVCAVVYVSFCCEPVSIFFVLESKFLERERENCVYFSFPAFHKTSKLCGYFIGFFFDVKFSLPEHPPANFVLIILEKINKFFDSRKYLFKFFLSSFFFWKLSGGSGSGYEQHGLISIWFCSSRQIKNYKLKTRPEELAPA